MGVPKPRRLVCPACGIQNFKHREWDKGSCCSRKCYLSLPFPLRPSITLREIERVLRMYETRQEAADALKVSYPQLNRAIKKFNLAERFPSRGGGRPPLAA